MFEGSQPQVPGVIGSDIGAIRPQYEKTSPSLSCKLYGLVSKTGVSFPRGSLSEKARSLQPCPVCPACEGFIVMDDAAVVVVVLFYPIRAQQYRGGDERMRLF